MDRRRRVDQPPVRYDAASVIASPMTMGERRHSVVGMAQAARSRPGGPRLTRNVVRGVHRLEHAYSNVYLIESDDPSDNRVTVVDTAFPRTWRLMPRVLAAIGRSESDVAAVILTHGHFDHVGFAKRAHDEWGVPIMAHAREAELVARPYSYQRQASPLTYPAQYPAALPVLYRMSMAGALMVPGVADTTPLPPDDVEVPGRPRVVFTPGHTLGHVALHLPDRDAILTGDALVTLDPYTGGRGAQVVSAAAAADIFQAFTSLDALAETEATAVLPGHGEPWFTGIRAAVTEARANGPS